MTIEKQILSNVLSLRTFTTAELQNNLGKELYLDRPRLNWYLSKLADKGKIARVARGTYTAVDTKNRFAPEISQKAINLYNQINKKFPEIKLCVYEGPWLFQFMHHLASNQVIYIEVEKDVAESVFHSLQDEGKNAYLRPNKELIYNYVKLDKGAVFVKKLTSESPLQQISGIKVPTLEKLLVDMYCDSDFFYLQGGEYNRIMHNARSRYTINLSMLLRYARRRNVSENIKNIYNNSIYDLN